MKKLLFLFLIGFNLCHSQENFVNSRKNIYVEDSLVYKVEDNKLFTGTIDFIRWNDVPLSKEIYENGYLIKKLQYFTKSAKGKVWKETVYFDKKLFQKEKVTQYHSTGEVYNITHYDLSGDKIFYEEFDKGKLVYSCEYKNGKKNGKEFCTTRNCGEETVIYSNGKKI